MTADTIAMIRDRLPADRIVTDAAELAEHATDASRQAAATAAVLVRPRSAQEVSVVLQVANATGTPVVPQGARSGLVGGAAALAGSILLDLTAIDAIVDIDVAERTARVQPGVIVAELQAAVLEHGLFYAPDPASADWASVGGTIATNAGGMRCIKYGVTRDAVRSLEIVLADGSIESTRPATVKGVAGLDLTGLVVGSEGTLAVVTEATVRLHPAPGPSRAIVALFAGTADALAAAADIASDRRMPSTLEFLDDTALRGIRTVRPDLAIDPAARSWLLAVTDDEAAADADLDRFTAHCRARGAVSIERADDDAAFEELMATRRALSPALNAIRGGATHGDLAVPRTRLREFAAMAEALAHETGAEISLAGHVGDGNLHPTVVYNPADADAARVAHDAAIGLLHIAQRLGGTVAGEHGIGTVKLDQLDAEMSPRIRQLQRAVKAVFDPNGILNPGRKL